MDEFMRQMQRSARRAGSGGGGGGGFSNVVKALLGVTAVGYGVANSLWNVEGGQRGVVYSMIQGVKPEVYNEGTHVRVPWIERPQVFDIRTRPITTQSYTGTRDLQMVDIVVRVLFRPNIDALPKIYSTLGIDYEERVMPSIVNETLKSVIAQFNASQLITQREQVSRKVKEMLTTRATDFSIIVDDVSITHLSFGKEYTAAVEAKQVAQQEAERARFIVDKALQDKKSTIIRAQGEAQSAILIGEALANNPGYVELRRLEAANTIANRLSQSPNQMYLNADSLLLNLMGESGSGNRLTTGGGANAPAPK